MRVLGVLASAGLAGCAILGATLLGMSSAAHAHELVIDTTAAHGVLDALGNPNLTPAEAHRIAEIPGNQQMTRKVASYGNGGDEALFESELLAVAHGATPANEKFYFSRVKKNLPDGIAALKDLEQNRDEYVHWILDRVQRFSPPGPPLHLTGYMIAGGPALGFAWGGPEFYLRINDFAGAPDYLKTTMAHELYHAVVGSAREAAKVPDDFNDGELAKIKSKPKRDAYAVRGILNQLKEEGSATLVGDPALTTSDGKLASNERDQLRNMTRLPRRIPALLDMVLVGVTANPALDFDDVYSVGFYSDQPLYYLGYAMAKAVAEKEGDVRLGKLQLGSGCDFAREYLKLSAADPSLVKLGTASVQRIRMACPVRTRR